MAIFAHSLKLLNKATLNAGNFLQLYTELDNQFAVGDQVTINGGYYDNASASSFTTFNPYTIKSYKVIAIDPTQNRITLNLNIPGTLYFPYALPGATTNTYGDPTDTVDSGYNFYNISTTKNLYKGVYISYTQFIRGKFKKGTVLNSILGCDKTPLKMNDTLYTIASITNVIVQHATFKNVILPAGTINNKVTGSAQTTQKLKAVEDIGGGFPLVQVPIGLENDTYGYSVFEKAELGDTVNPANFFVNVTSNWLNNQVANSGVGNNQFWQCNFSNCRIGDNNPIDIDVTGNWGANNTHASIFNNCDVRNIFVNKNTMFAMTNGRLSNNYALKITTTSITYGTAGKILVTCNYDTLANNYFDPVLPCMVVGILKATTLDPAVEFLTPCNIESAAYTYGVQSSASFVLNFPGLVAGWATILSTYPNPATALNWTNCVIYQGSAASTGSLLQVVLLDSLSEIQTYLIGAAIPNTDAVIKNPSISAPATIKKSFLKFAILENYININQGGINYNDFSYIENCTQITTIGNTLKKWNWSYIVASGYTYIYEAEFTNTIHVGGNYTNSIFTNSIVYSPTTANPVFLYMCAVKDRTIISASPSINWEKCSFNPIVDYYSGTTLVQGGRFGYRKAAFATADTSIASIGKANPNAFVFNMNNKKVVTSASTAPITTEAVVQVSSSPYHYFRGTFVPVSKAALAPSSTSIVYAQYDLGDKIFVAGNWVPLNNRNRLMISDTLVNSQLNTTLNNVDTMTTAGVYDTNFIKPPIEVATASGLDTNYAYNYDGYYKNTKSATNVWSMSSSLEIEPVIDIPAGFPQRAGLNPHVDIILALKPTAGSDIPIAYYETPTTTPNTINTGIPTGIYNFSFTHYAYQAIFATVATLVPKSFIEIEGYTIIESPAGSFTASSVTYTSLRHSFTGFYLDDTSMSYASVPVNPIYPVKITLGANRRLQIKIDFWVTSYISGAYGNCGMKVLQSYTWVIENP